MIAALEALRHPKSAAPSSGRSTGSSPYDQAL